MSNAAAEAFENCWRKDWQDKEAHLLPAEHLSAWIQANLYLNLAEAPFDRERPDPQTRGRSVRKRGRVAVTAAMQGVPYSMVINIPKRPRGCPLTYGAPRMAAFQAEPDIHKAVTAFCEATVNTATGDARGGCMMAASALGQSERVMEIRSCAAKGLTASADIFAKRFEQEMKAGRLTRTPSAKVRGRALVDLMQGLQLRAKVGIAREQLLQDARSYVPLILGK
jgi:hypothetical protein